MAVALEHVLSKMSRLALTSGVNSCRTFVTQSEPLAFRYTAPLSAEPLKKKKKMDVNIIVQREQKKRRRLEKAIRRLIAKGRIPKPITEIEGDRGVVKTMKVRKRKTEPIKFEESERRALLRKDWSRFKLGQHIAETAKLNVLLHSQQRALQELRGESEQLYQMAIQIDPDFVPFNHQGPYATPPIKDYLAPDGEYIDTTRKYDRR